MRGRRGVIRQYLEAYQMDDQASMQKLETENPGLFSGLNNELIKKAIGLP